MKRALSCWLGAGSLALGILATGATPAAAVGPPICTGTEQSPGVLAGRYSSDVIVEGACEVNSGPALVEGNLIVRPGGVLVAAFALNDRTGTGKSSLTVHGNVVVKSGATLILGCDPQSFACIDNRGEYETPTLSSKGRVFGNLIERKPLGVVVHDSVIYGNVRETGGGGGRTCAPSGIFALFGSPVYSDYEDSTVHGNLSVSNLESCWLGVARVRVGGNVGMINDQLLDPDAIEILSNRITGNLVCVKNSQVWDSAEERFESLFPRIPEPNTVHGRRMGQCVLASPTEEGGPPGPGPF
jgi:hypothetical protein